MEALSPSLPANCLEFLRDRHPAVFHWDGRKDGLIDKESEELLDSQSPQRKLGQPHLILWPVAQDFPAVARLRRSSVSRADVFRKRWRKPEEWNSTLFSRLTCMPEETAKPRWQVLGAGKIEKCS